MAFLQRFIAAFLSLFGLIAAVPPQAQMAFPSNVQTLDVRIMSYNVYVFDTGRNRHEKRAPGVVANIRSVAPDVFGLQEANLDWMQRIADALPDYAFVGVGRDDGVQGGEFSPVFYRTDRFEKIDGGTFWFSDTPDEPSRTWRSRFHRICSWAVLREKDSSFSFAVFNSHWDHLSVESRERSAALLIKKAKAYAPDLPVVILGDFNCKANTEAYQTLIDAGFVDSMSVSPETSNIGSFHGYYKLSTVGELPIDHILFLKTNGYSAAYHVVTDRYDGRYPSDHFPIVSDLTLYTLS